MRSITDASPHLVSEVRAVGDVREELRANFDHIMLRLADVSSNDAAAVAEVCAELECYLEQLQKHGQKEIELLQHSYVQEEGGEG